jgi:hypothetical protein
MKTRTMNELRQEKNYGYKQPEPKAEEYWPVKEGEIDLGYSEIDIETTKDLIFNQLKNQLFDIMFQAVSEEMAKHEVFQAETYFTPQGEEWFEDEWFQFYHEHHGDILGDIMKSFTN